MIIGSWTPPHPQASASLWKAGQREKPSSLLLGSVVSTRVPVPPGSGLGFPGTPFTDVSPECDSGSSPPEVSLCSSPNVFWKLHLAFQVLWRNVAWMAPWAGGPWASKIGNLLKVSVNGSQGDWDSNRCGCAGTGNIWRSLVSSLPLGCFVETPWWLPQLKPFVGDLGQMYLWKYIYSQRQLWAWRLEMSSTNSHNSKNGKHCAKLF